MAKTLREHTVNNADRSTTTLTLQQISMLPRYVVVQYLPAGQDLGPLCHGHYYTREEADARFEVIKQQMQETRLRRAYPLEESPTMAPKADWQYREDFDAAVAALGLREALERLAALFESAKCEHLANTLFDLSVQVPEDAALPPL